MKKLFGSLLLGMFLCVSGAAYAQDAPKPDETKKSDTSKDKKKSKKKKEEKKDETKKEDKKPG